MEEMERWTMKFEGEIPTEGTFTTIRLGDKWALRLHVGDMVDFADKDGNPSDYYGEVHKVKGDRIKNLTVNELREEHNPTARSPLGLLFTLQRIYEVMFTFDTVVTVVRFTAHTKEATKYTEYDKAVGRLASALDDVMRLEGFSRRGG